MTAPGSAPVSGTAAAEAIWDALDAAHDNAWHVHAAECCWSFPGSLDAIAAALAAAGLLADPDATEAAAAREHEECAVLLEGAADEIERLRATVRAVESLHHAARREAWPGPEEKWSHCAHCRQPMPCPTLAAIRAVRDTAEPEPEPGKCENEACPNCTTDYVECSDGDCAACDDAYAAQGEPLTRTYPAVREAYYAAQSRRDGEGDADSAAEPGRHMEPREADPDARLEGAAGGEAAAARLEVAAEPVGEVGRARAGLTAVCECGHPAGMHGEVTGDTACRRRSCPCVALRTDKRTCPACGAQWTAAVDDCPVCTGIQPGKAGQ